jgi:hypothetical protein
MVWFVERILPALALMNRSPEREELIHLARELRDLDREPRPHAAEVTDR